MVFNIGTSNSIANQFLLELRDKDIQQDRFRFRENVKRLGWIMAYEISKHLSYSTQRVQTPLGQTDIAIPAAPVLMTVLRAGLPYLEGFQAMFEQSDCGFIGAYRDEAAGELTVQLGYMASPNIEGRTLILIDPMLATGRSLLRSIAALKQWGTPDHIHFAALVAAPDGIEALQQAIKTPYSIWTFAVDDKLNEQFYIVPGLGDAGDLCFGEKNT
jgi:uracil phosphoribosyltransferase